MHILRCMGSKFCVKFQRAPLKFHTKFWTHTPQNVHFTIFIFCVRVTISLNCDVISLSETGPRCTVAFFRVWMLHNHLGYSLSEPSHWTVFNQMVPVPSPKSSFTLALPQLKPSIAHTIPAQVSSKLWSHTVPHSPPYRISRSPLVDASAIYQTYLSYRKHWN